MLLIVGLSAVSCFSNQIEFNVLSIKPPLERKIVLNKYLPMVSKVASKEELSTFYKEQFIESVDIEDINEFQVFNDEFFAEKSLLLICYSGDENMNITINDISLRGNELFVIFNADTISALTHYTYFFVSVNKVDITNVNKFSYVIKS